MNYQRHYNRLISRAIGRETTGYYEKHHVRPKCMGGGNQSWNIVKLTIEEHFIAHRLLCKIYPDNNLLLYAFYRMLDGRKKSNKLYGFYRRKGIDMIRSRERLSVNRAKNSVMNERRTFTKETRRKISLANTGKKQSLEICKQISSNNKIRYGEKAGNVKICDGIARMIKKDLRDTTMTVTQLAKFYHVHRKIVCNIKTGRSWSHVII